MSLANHSERCVLPHCAVTAGNNATTIFSWVVSILAQSSDKLAAASGVAIPDDAGSSVTWTSMGIEVGCWAILYIVFVGNLLVPFVRKTLSSKSFWDDMSKRPGQALTNQAEESVLCISISAHHLFGGVLMLVGQINQDSNMWLHGLFVEISFEIVDVLALTFNQWPYTVVQPGLRLITLFHHFPGLIAAPNMIMNGAYHKNVFLQAIGWSLLLAGGVSLLTDSIKQTRNLNTQLGQWLALHLVNMTGVIFARFLVFPVASYGLLKHCWEESPEYIAYLATFGVGSMAVFNIVVLAIMTEKLIKNGKTYLCGTSNKARKQD